MTLLGFGSTQKTRNAIEEKFEQIKLQQKIEPIIKDWDKISLGGKSKQNEFIAELIRNNKHQLNAIFTLLIKKDLTSATFPEKNSFFSALIKNVYPFANSSKPNDVSKLLHCLLWHLNKAGVEPNTTKAKNIVNTFIENNFDAEIDDEAFTKIDPLTHVESIELDQTTVTAATTQGGPNVRYAGKNEDTYSIGALNPAFFSLSETGRATVWEKTFDVSQEKCGQVPYQGSTAIACANTQKKYSIASVGDSLAFVVFRDKKTGCFVQCELINKKQHNYDNPSERERISPENFTASGRLKEKPENKDGVAATRAIGGTAYKKSGLLHTPEIFEGTVEIPEDQEAFILLASDGLVERHTIPGEQPLRKTPDDEYLRDKLNRFKGSTQELPAYLIDEAINYDEGTNTNGSTDNITLTLTPLGISGTTVTALFDGYTCDEKISQVSIELKKTVQPTLNEEILKEILEQDKRNIDYVLQQLILQDKDLADFPSKDSYLNRLIVKSLKKMFTNAPGEVPKEILFSRILDGDVKSGVVRNEFLIFFLWQLQNAGIPFVGSSFRNNIHSILTSFLQNNGIDTAFSAYEVQRFYKKIDAKIHTPIPEVATTQGGPHERCSKKKSQDAYATGALTTCATTFDNKSFDEKKMETVLNKMGEELQDKHGKYPTSGSTGNLCILRRKKTSGAYQLSGAYRGDSQAFLVYTKKGTTQVTRIDSLSKPHDGSNPDEVARLGADKFDGKRLRLDNETEVPDSHRNSIGMSRGFGNTRFVPEGFSHEQSFYHRTVEKNNDEDVSLVIISDGITEAADLLKKQYTDYLSETWDGTAEGLVLKARLNGSTDNITAVVKKLEITEDDSVAVQDSFYAVYDGHGREGRKTSTGLANNTQTILNDSIQAEIQRQESLEKKRGDLKSKTENYRNQLNKEIDAGIEQIYSLANITSIVSDTRDPVTGENNPSLKTRKIDKIVGISEQKSNELKKPINEKLALLDEVDNLIDTLSNEKNPDVENEDKLKNYANMLFKDYKKDKIKPSLAEKIENHNGHKFINVAVTILVGASILGIPLAVYWNKHKFPWDTQGKQVVNEAQEYCTAAPAA
jgi:serine/threonine protein phosphatase PrpC